jgi:hypothetical protein
MDTHYTTVKLLKYYMKEVRQKGSQVLWFYLYEMFWKANPETECSLVGISGNECVCGETMDIDCLMMIRFLLGVVLAPFLLL